MKSFGSMLFALVFTASGTFSMTACADGGMRRGGETAEARTQSQALQGDAGARPEHHRRDERHERRGERRLDQNGDGKIEISELPEKMRERLAGADTNKDGVLSKDELEAHRRAHMQEKFARLDTNKDGALSESEVPSRFWERLKKADQNNDGKVTPDEMRTAWAARHQDTKQDKK